jgi:hypothetical protein
MEIPSSLTARVAEWDRLSRWERSEVGRDLRRLGLSYGEIREQIDVKKSTLATWCRDIALTENQKQEILARTGSRASLPVDTNWRRRLEVEAIRQEASHEAEFLLSDPRWVAGVVLYWCEGAKTRNHLAVANSDPAALRLFVAWIRRYVNEGAEFVLRLHLHEGNDDMASRQWWLNELDLTGTRFHKTFVKPAGTGHRKNHLRYGVCTAKVVRPSNSWHRITTWIDELRQWADREYTGQAGKLDPGRWRNWQRS